MPQDPFVREKFTRERNAAKKLAAEYFEAVPDRGRELAPSAIAKYRVHREAAARADQRGVNVELTELEIVILRGLDAKPALDVPGGIADDNVSELIDIGYISVRTVGNLFSYEITDDGRAALKRSGGSA